MGRIINKQAVTDIATEIRQTVEEQMARPVDPALLQQKAEKIKELTGPMLDKIVALQVHASEVTRDLAAWRRELTTEGLQYIDYSRLLNAPLLSKKLREMLEDRLANPEKWAKAAINSNV